MRPTPIQPIGLVGFVVFARLKFVVQKGLECGFHILNLALGDQPITDQTFGVKRKRGFLLFDLVIHDRVGKHRLVAFVVTKPTVTENIQDHVFVEFLAEFCRDFCRVHNRLWIVAVHVENRRFDHQCDIRWIGR